MAVVMVVGSAAPAYADRAFLRMAEGDIAIVGESPVKAYEHWTEVDAVAWHVTAESSWTKGGGASVGKPLPGELTWVQTFESSVPSMYRYVLTGLSVPSVTVEFVKGGDAGPVTFAQLALTDAFFTELSLDGATVHGGLVFKKMTQTVWLLNADGTRGERTTVSWDIPGGTATPSGALAAFVPGYGPGNLSPAPVPEPETWALLAGGLIAVAGALRRRARGVSGVPAPGLGS
jgi:type VI secretion system secreted protein Hcp